MIDRRVAAREYQASSPDADDELRSPYVRDDKLDLSAWARDALVRSTCRSRSFHDPDCAGLCPVCGKDLNDEPHEEGAD